MESMGYKALTVEDLSDRVSKFSEEKLITEAEKSAIGFYLRRGKEKAEVELFRLLMKKDIVSSHRMLNILKNETEDNESNESFGEDEVENGYPTPTTNPLKIAGVIHCLLGFVPLKDIKSCRLVSKEFNHVAQPFLRKLSQISIGNPSYSLSFRRSYENFNSAFELCECDIPFNALKLTQFKGNSAPWPKAALEKIFDDWRNNLKELTIDKIKIGKEKLQSANIMSDLFDGLQITKLVVTGSPAVGPLKFSLEKLLHVKHLQLNDCDLIIPEGCRSSATYVNIKVCQLLFRNASIENNLNTFLNFEQIKTFIFHGYKSGQGQRMKLDMNGEFQLDLLELAHVSILNWGASKWTVDKITLTQTDFSGVSAIHVREMTVDNHLASLRYIPQSVEKLTCVNTVCGPPIYLPNLKYLVLSGNQLSILQHFKSCTSIVDLRIRVESPSENISSNWFPKNLQKLNIDGAVSLVGRETVDVGVLILERFPADSIKNVIRKLRGRRFLWLLSKQGQSKFKGVTELLERKDIRVAVGQFNWKLTEFVNSRFSQLVDKESEFYLFANKRGKAISEQQFNEIMNLQ